MGVVVAFTANLRPDVEGNVTRLLLRMLKTLKPEAVHMSTGRPVVFLRLWRLAFARFSNPVGGNGVVRVIVYFIQFWVPCTIWGL